MTHGQASRPVPGPAPRSIAAGHAPVCTLASLALVYVTGPAIAAPLVSTSSSTFASTVPPTVEPIVSVPPPALTLRATGACRLMALPPARTSRPTVAGAAIPGSRQRGGHRWPLRPQR